MNSEQLNISIHRATPSDAETLAHIGVATFVDTYTEVVEGPAMMAHCTRQHSQSVYETYLADPHSQCWLAEYTATRAPIGYAVLCPPDLPVETQPGDLELKRIYVLSRFHGTGAGRALLDAVMQQCHAQKAPRLLLGTYQENDTALSFYRRNGFEQIGVRQFQVGDILYDDIVMGRCL